MDQIIKYFPNLTTLQKQQFVNLDSLYREWNSKINVISRKDIDSLYLHHVLHSLAIAKVVDFPTGSTVLDIGTGGGFPGIPLAILFPDVKFTLCDSIGKKITVAKGVAESLELSNVTTVNCRAEEIRQHFDYIVSRAVASLSDFVPWVKGKYREEVIYLKGGELDQEISDCVKWNKIDRGKIAVYDITNWFEEDYFREKKIIIIRQ